MKNLLSILILGIFLGGPFYAYGKVGIGEVGAEQLANIPGLFPGTYRVESLTVDEDGRVTEILGPDFDNPLVVPNNLPVGFICTLLGQTIGTVQGTDQAGIITITNDAPGGGVIPNKCEVAFGEAASNSTFPVCVVSYNFIPGTLISIPALVVNSQRDSFEVATSDLSDFRNGTKINYICLHYPTP